MCSMNPIYELLVLEALRRQCEARRTDPRVVSPNSGIGVGIGIGKNSVGGDSLIVWIESRERCVYADLARRCVHPASATPPTAELVEQVAEFTSIVRGVVRGSLASLCRLTPANGNNGAVGSGHHKSTTNNNNEIGDGDGVVEKRENWKSFLQKRIGTGTVGPVSEEEHFRSSTSGHGWRWMDFIGVHTTARRPGGVPAAAGEESHVNIPSFEQWDVELQSVVRRVGDVVSAAHSEMLLALDQLGDGRFPYLADETYTFDSPSVWMQLVVLFENAFEAVVRGVLEFMLWCMHQQFLGYEGLGVRPLFTVKALWSYSGKGVVFSPTPPELHERIMGRVKKELIWNIVPEFTLSHMTKRPVPSIGRAKRPLLRDLLMEDATMKRLWDNIYYTVSQRCDELSDMTRNLTENYTFYFSHEVEYAQLDIQRLRELRETIRSASHDFIRPVGTDAFAIQIEPLLQAIQEKLEKSLLTAMKALEEAEVRGDVKKMTPTRCRALFDNNSHTSHNSTLTDRLNAFRAGRKVHNKYDRGLEPEAHIARLLEEQRAESLRLRSPSSTTGGQESSSALLRSSQKSSSGSTIPTVSAPVTVIPTPTRETSVSKNEKYVNRWAPAKISTPTASKYSTQETLVSGNAMEILKSRGEASRPTSASRLQLNHIAKNIPSSQEEQLQSRYSNQTSPQRPPTAAAAVVVEKTTESSFSSLSNLRQDRSRGAKNYSPTLNLQGVKQRPCSTSGVLETVNKERLTSTATPPSRYDTQKEKEKKMNENTVNTDTVNKEHPPSIASHSSRPQTLKEKKMNENTVNTDTVVETVNKEHPLTSVTKPTVINAAAVETAVKRVEAIKKMCPFLPETPCSGVFLEDLNLSDPRIETAMNRLRAVRGNASVIRSYRSIALAEDAVSALVESIADDVYKSTVRMMTFFPFLESRVGGVLLGNIPELETDVEFQSLLTVYRDLVREDKPTTSVIQCLQERACELANDIPYIVAEARYKLQPLLRPKVDETPTSAVAREDDDYNKNKNDDDNDHAMKVIQRVEKPAKKVSELNTLKSFTERRRGDPVVENVGSVLPTTTSTTTTTTTVKEKPIQQSQEQNVSQEKQKSLETTKPIRGGIPSLQKSSPEMTKPTTKMSITSEYASKSSKVKEGESTETSNVNKNDSSSNVSLSYHSTPSVDNNARKNYMQTALGSNVDKTTGVEKNDYDVQTIRPTGNMNNFPASNKLFEERKPKRSLDGNFTVLPAVGERNVHSASSTTRTGKEMTLMPLKDNSNTQSSVQSKPPLPTTVHNSPLVNIAPVEDHRHGTTDSPSFTSIKKVLEEEREQLENLESILKDIRQAEVALQAKKEQSKGNNNNNTTTTNNNNNTTKRRLSEEAPKAVSNEDGDVLKKTLPLPRRFSATPPENISLSNAAINTNLTQRTTTATTTTTTTTTTIAAANEKKEAVPLGPLFEERHSNPIPFGRKAGSEAEVLRQLFRERWKSRELNPAKESELKDHIKLGEGNRENTQQRTPMSFNSFTDAVVRSSWGALRNDSDISYSQQLPSLPRTASRLRRFPLQRQENQLTQQTQQTQSQQLQQTQQTQSQQQQSYGQYSNKQSRLPWGRYTLHRKIPGTIGSPRRLSSAPETSHPSDDSSMPFPAIGSGSSVDNLPQASQDSQWECISNITTGMSQQYAALCRQAGIRPNSMLLRLLPDTHGASVSRIDTSVNYIGPKGLLPLLQVLRGNIGLEYLNLSHNNLENDEVIDLVNVLMTDCGASLKYLDLSNNPVSLAGGAALLRLVQSRPLLVNVGLKGTLVPRQLARSIQEACEANNTALA